MTTKGQLITLKSGISILHPVYMQVCERIINGAFFRNHLFCSNSNFAGHFSRACLKNKSCTKHIFPRPFS
ncbi:Uncharacterised protein [Anaerobutyricum hallii]|uniref:Uncharacterized protein n=1 Tax=Anaerobutyricum hallii TaxID=39488 RepID=A0A174KUI4_9FIRM|nr:hypothetical protein [Anaerobutyricum hallii]MBP0063316.1 hypothetical protein [Anaerobutyricum hallii]CUP15874.1 Uncharacterised protein [Anaerobutyricum hallii]